MVGVCVEGSAAWSRRTWTAGGTGEHVRPLCVGRSRLHPYRAMLMSGQHPLRNNSFYNNRRRLSTDSGLSLPNGQSWHADAQDPQRNPMLVFPQSSREHRVYPWPRPLRPALFRKALP